jgi:glycosyltransferase involved in cell wall biosynthesis
VLTPKLGIAVITYNRRNLALRAVDIIESSTTREHVLLVADDGSKDGTASALRAMGVKVATGENRGVAWNKNRALFYLFHIACCDAAILMEDDCFPTRDGWQADWLAAAMQWGHVNLAGSWFKEAFLSGSGTLDDPVRCARLSGQCTAFSREAISFTGYVDTRYRGYGYAHAEHSERLVRGGYGGTIEVLGDKPQPVFYMISGDVHVEAAETFRDPKDVSRNATLYGAIRHESVHRWAWRTDEEMQVFREEMLSV